jgi:hypothetical protein
MKWQVEADHARTSLVCSRRNLQLGLAMFMPMVQYLVLEAYRKDPKGTGWFVLHPTLQSIAITMAVLCESQAYPRSSSPR